MAFAVKGITLYKGRRDKTKVWRGLSACAGGAEVVSTI